MKAGFSCPKEYGGGELALLSRTAGDFHVFLSLYANTQKQTHRRELLLRSMSQ